MTHFIIKILIAIIIILTILIVYTLLCKRNDLQHEGWGNKATENKVIKDSNDVILREPLQNLCIMASSDSITLDGNASIGNIEPLIETGVRWLDFDVADNNGVPFVSEIISLEKVLYECKRAKNLSQNAKMPLFINIRVSSIGSVDFYNNIHSFFNKVFTKGELYNSPGEVKTPLSDAKKNVMKILKSFKDDTGSTINSLEKEPFENTNGVLGTENELYENLTPVEIAYRSNKTTEGLQNKDEVAIEVQVVNQQEKVDEIKKSLAYGEKQLMAFFSRVKKVSKNMSKELEMKLKKEYEILNREVKYLRQSLMREEKKRIELKAQQKKSDKKSTDKIEKDMNEFGRNAETKYDNIDTNETQGGETLIGVPASVQKKFDKKHSAELVANYEKGLIQRDLGKLENKIRSDKQSIMGIGTDVDKLYASVEKVLTKPIQCKRCITGETTLVALGNKVIFVLTRSKFFDDSYKKSKLSMPGKDGLVNIEINDYNNDSGEKFYNVDYSKDNRGTTLPKELMKITTVSSDTTNAKNMILNNIQKHQIQVLQVPNLENKTEYVDMFNYHESAFIPMSEVSKYIDKQNWQ